MATHIAYHLEAQRKQRVIERKQEDLQKGEKKRRKFQAVSIGFQLFQPKHHKNFTYFGQTGVNRLLKTNISERFCSCSNCRFSKQGQ